MSGFWALNGRARHADQSPPLEGAREATRLQLCNSLEDDTAGHMADGEMVGGKRVEEVYRARRGLWPPGCEPCAGADDCVHHSRRPAIIGMGRTEQHDA